MLNTPANETIRKNRGCLNRRLHQLTISFLKFENSLEIKRFLHGKSLVEFNIRFDFQSDDFRKYLLH